MATIDPRTPVLVGAGQFTRSGRDTGTSPLVLAATAADAALNDTGGRVADRIDTVGFVNALSWPVSNPAAQLATDLGLRPRTTLATHIGGTGPVELLAHGCRAICDGRSDAVLLAGAEALKSYREGRYDPAQQHADTAPPDAVLGSDRSGIGEPAQAAGILQPVQFYPLFENALRAAAGRGRRDHERRIAGLWERFATVAKTNPHAWVTGGATAESILDGAAGNRPVAEPYRKLLTANIFVDQAAALVLCSAEAATAAGVPRENWVFVHATAAANDHWLVAERDRLDRSPAVAAIARELLRGGSGIDDIAHLDLYSCFPSAVQVAAAEYGVDLADDARTPTVTGGLTFAGGPGNNYVTHSLAALVGRLRDDPGGYGLATAVGWYLTKHAATLLSGRPAKTPYRHSCPQEVVDNSPSRTAATGFAGTATVETYTVTYDRAGEPERAHAACLTDAGARALVSSDDPGIAARMARTDPVGARVRVDGPALLEW